MKYLSTLMTLLLWGGLFCSAQDVLPYYVAGGPNQANYFDKATRSSLTIDLLGIPCSASSAIDNSYVKNICQWAGGFFNVSGTKYTYSPNNSVFWHYYQNAFFEKAKKGRLEEFYGGFNIFSNSKCISYLVMYTNTTDSTQLYMDVATFDRYQAHRLSFDEIFSCDRSKVREIMEQYRPQGFDPSPTDIVVGNACITQDYIYVIGSVYHGQTIFKIPFDVAEQYLTDQAYTLHDCYMARSGAHGDMGNNGFDKNIKRIQQNLHNDNVTVSKYHNGYVDEDYKLQIDIKYTYNKEGVSSNSQAKKAAYVEVQSDDMDKVVFLQMMKKSDVVSFRKLLTNCLSEYDKWVEKMRAKNFQKYKPTEYKKGPMDICYYSSIEGWTIESGRGFEIIFLYNARTKQPYLEIKSTTMDAKSNIKIGLTPNISTNVTRNNLSGWTITMRSPKDEISDLVSALEVLEKSME